MQILVLVKPVPEAETRLRPNESGTDFDASGVKWVLAGYDESAVEQALLLKESVPGSAVRAISAGPAPRTEEILRSAIALGCDAATWVELPGPTDPLATAQVLAGAVRRYPFDLILVGKQSVDDEAGIVGPALAEFLGIADFGVVADLRANEGKTGIRFQRVLEGGTERGEAGLPAVVALQQAWNDPRTAKLPNILKSRKAPIDKLSVADLGGAVPPRSRPTAFRLPPPRTGAKMIEYKTPEEAAQRLVHLLREEAKVFP